ncbi:MAG: hypothetical protein QOC68_2996 [Solirubrobacteraceae bacterium]|nr:hypothetical protein [Solirubrobacteraceae bacterium]
MVNLRLLGPLEAHFDGRPIELGPRKQRAVLAMLALEAGRTVSSDRLAEGLWGDELPASAPKMVQVYVSHLRRLLEGDSVRIVTRGRGYELQLSDGEIDVVRFERLLEQSRPREALALWRGEALADVADEPFAAAEIRRLDELWLRGSESAIDVDLVEGRHADVLGELERLVAAHPLREHLHAQYMLALYRSGRQSEALAAYRDARAGLVEQIGVEPGGELRRLHDAILAQDPALEPAAAAAEPGRGAPPPSRARRSRRLLITAAALLVGGVLAFGVIRVLEPGGRTGIDEDAVGLIDLGSGRITTEYPVGHGPQALAAGAGSVWVANQLDGTVSRIDRGRSEVVTIPVGGEPTGLAFGAGSLWVADGQGRRVIQIAPQSNKEVQRIPVGNAAGAVALGYGAVWVASAVDATVVRIDLRSGKPGPPIPVQARPSALAAGAGAIWVASDATASVVRLDPRSGTPLTSISVGDGAGGVAVGAGAVWVANRNDGTVTRIDPDSEVTETVPVGREPRAVAADRDGVWVANAGDGTVMRIDPRSHRAAQTFGVASSPAALAVVDGALWTAALAPASAHRGGTLRTSSAPTTSPAGDSVDPAYLSPLVPLAYDGLTAYRRAGGSAGGTLVPDLARELPEPSADGRTYRFRLRAGVRFSNGAALRPNDVRASIERMQALAAHGDGYFELLPIRGTARCKLNLCDLSRGIETDAVAKTVTIHLSRRDPDVLHKLSSDVVVPAGSPAKLVTTRPLPGTGPYMFERWRPRGDGLLVRNPHFRLWSPDRPDGFPDQIAVRHERADAQIAAVEHGATDVALLDYGVRGIAELRTRYGARLHSDPAAQTTFVFLNVLTPPFDDRNVRRALNYAVDRGRVAELLGGPETQHQTCQLLPPGFPGYTPSCRYTVNPNPAGIWTGPDMARARRLVADSGTRGMKVEFWGAPGFGPVDRYFRSLLHELGYRSELRTFSDLGLIFKNARGEPRPRPQLGIAGWIADSAAPYSFLQPLVSCSGDANLSRLCHPKLDVRMQQGAIASGLEAIETWRGVEAALAKQAPTVPLANGNDTALLAKRVGNYQHHPLWGPLLDQMWVK